MIPNKKFLGLDKEFWANVRLISQEVGYSERKTKKIKIPNFEEVRRELEKRQLKESYIFNSNSQLTPFGESLFEYFHYRSHILNDLVEPRLMSVDTASNIFFELKDKLSPECPIPMNKQKKEKKAPAYFTGIINMLIEANSDGFPCDYDPRTLTTFTRNGKSFRTLARRVDGAFPSATDPVAIWEIKEYYYTKTFGSRVADAVYETLLDGMELEEVRHMRKRKIRHYLMVDDYFTWWTLGKSYLCRIIDTLHMGRPLHYLSKEPSLRPTG